MCLPTFFNSTGTGSKADPTRPQVQLPAPHTTPTAGTCKLSLDLWNRIAGPWHLQVLTHGIPLEWTNGSSPFNQPFDWARPLVGKPKDLQSCRDTLQHYLAIGSVRPLKDQSGTLGVWPASFPVPKKGTD